MDEDGYFTIVDRKTDMILTAGYNVYPAELERVLCMHPAVALAAVTGVPDEVKGELAKAYVVLKPGSDSDRRGTRSPTAASTSPPTRSRVPCSSSTRCRSPHPARSCAAFSRTSTTGRGSRHPPGIALGAVPTSARPRSDRARIRRSAWASSRARRVAGWVRAAALSAHRTASRGVQWRGRPRLPRVRVWSCVADNPRPQRGRRVVEVPIQDCLRRSGARSGNARPLTAPEGSMTGSRKFRWPMLATASGDRRPRWRFTER